MASSSGNYEAGDLICSVLAKPLGQSSIHRASFLDELVKLVPRDRVSFGKKLATIRPTGADEMTLHFDDSTTATHNLVIGCDGIKSAVRRIVLSPSSKSSIAHFSGKYAYRGLIPMSTASTHPDLGPGLTQNAQMYLSYDGHVLTFPIAKGETMNVVAFRSQPPSPPSTAASEASSAGAPDRQLPRWPHGDTWVVNTTREEMARDFADWSPAVRAIISMMQKPDKWALFDHDDYPAARYHSTDYRIVLAGDAAHGSTPHHGAGAGMSIEDALVLSRLLGEVTRRMSANSVARRTGPTRASGAPNPSASSPSDLLKKAVQVYDQVRRPRSQRLVHTSRIAGMMYDFEGPETGDDPARIAADLQQRYRWIWEADLERHAAEAVDALRTAIAHDLAASEPTSKGSAKL